MASYSYTKSLQPTQAPDWLTDAARRTPPRRTGSHRRGSTPLPIDDGSPIPIGQRNNTMASILGGRHDGTRTLEELEEDALRINEALCETPLPEDEVRRIARSIYRYEPCTPKTKKTTPEVIGGLGKVLAAWWAAAWPNIGGKSRRDFMLALILLALTHGEILPNGGIKVSVSFRQLAEVARMSLGATYRAFVALRQMGWVLGGGNGPDRRPREAAGIAIVTPDAQARISGTLTTKQGSPPKWLESVPPVRAPSARRGRHSAPGLSRTATKTRMAVVDYLERVGGWLSEADLAGLLCIKRPRDAKRRHLEPLEERGVLERSGKRWRLVVGWEEALERIFAEEADTERRLYGGKTADEMQEERNARSRSGFIVSDTTRPERAPTEHEMEARREERRKTRETHTVKIAEVDRRFRKPDPMPTDAHDLYERLVWRRVAEIERDFAKTEAPIESRGHPRPSTTASTLPDDWRDHPRTRTRMTG